MTLPSDVQRAPSDRDLGHSAFELEVADDIALAVSKRAPVKVEAWRAGRWVLRGSPEDTGAKAPAHAITTCIRFKYARITDAPADHPWQGIAFRFECWGREGKPSSEEVITAVLSRFHAAEAAA